MHTLLRSYADVRSVFWAKCRIAVGCILVAFATGCHLPSNSCGFFVFSGQPKEAFTGRTADKGLAHAEIQFQFRPEDCGMECACGTVAFIQVAKIYDFDTGEIIAASSEQLARTIQGEVPAWLKGWAVDRTDTNKWGYYGRRNDGFFTQPLGSNIRRAIIADEPGQSDPDRLLFFYFIDVPVCIDENSQCRNGILGYQYWWFTTGRVFSGPYDRLGEDWMADAADLAIAEWNNHAAALNKTPFPPFKRLVTRPP